MQLDNFLFTLNERPPLLKNFIYGLQWVMIAIPNVVVFSALCGAALGLDPAAQIGFSQRLLIVTGLMTLLQSLKGHQYPILEGPSSALLLTFIVLAPYGFPAIGGGMMVGGLLLLLVYKLRLFKKLSAFFTPNVVGVILMLVALSLLPFTYPLLIGMDPVHPQGEISIVGSSFLIILFVALFSYWLKGFFQTTSMLAGILLGFFIFLIKGELSLAAVRESSWFALPDPLWGGGPSFSLAPILAMVFTYVAVMINTVGSIQGISEIVGKDGLDERTHRGIGLTGAGGVAAGLFGVVGLVSFSISPGVVLVTRVASRFALSMSGGIMIVSAFIPKLWAFLNAIPPSVTAAVLFVVLSMQLLAGMTVILSGKGKIERREYFTVGLPLLLGATVSMIPRPFFQLIPGAIAPLLSNGLVVGILFALLFEHVVFKPRP